MRGPRVPPGLAIEEINNLVEDLEYRRNKAEKRLAHALRLLRAANETIVYLENEVDFLNRSC